MRANSILATVAALMISTAPAFSLESTMTVSSPLTPDELWKKGRRLLRIGGMESGD